MGGGEGYKSVAYFTNWSIYARKYFPKDIPADKLTHILYSFADNRDDGTVFLTDTWSDTDIRFTDDGDSWNDTGKNLYGNLKQLNLAKQKNRNLKLLLSIGGWTYTQVSKHMDGPASTEAGRKRFAESCVQLIKDMGFDGIDVDWEYPANLEQGQHLLLLLKEIRKQMDEYAETLKVAYGEKPHFALTIAAPAGAQNYVNYPLKELAEVLDFINLMAYDFSGSWESTAGHQANLYASSSCPSCTPFNTDAVVQAYINAGVPSSKIVLGQPLYGRAFTNTKGLGQPFNGVGSPDFEKFSWEGGVWDYKALPLPGSNEILDQEAGAVYSYDIATGILVSYDNEMIARSKAVYIKEKSLGGAMWWELSGDRKQGEGSLVETVAKELGGPEGGKLEQTQNWIQYPDSKYDNLRNKFA